MELLVSALVIGVFLGTIYGLMSFGLVASYRISRVVNLGQAGLAALGAAVYYWFTAQWGAPVIVAVIAAILAGAVAGAALGYANMRMADWPKGFIMIFTLCVTLLIFATVDWKLLPSANGGVSVISPFGDGGFNFALTYVAWHQVGSFLLSIAVVLGATMLIRVTRFGLYVRAIYDDPDSAATLGIPLAVYVIGVWAMSGGMAGLAGLLVANRTLLDTIALLFVTVWGLAGAVLGGLESFGLAFGGALILGCSQGVIGGMWSGYLPAGTENLGAVAVMAAAVLIAGTRRRHLADMQT